MKGKDSYQFQRARIEQIVKELDSHATVKFDEASTWLRFKVRNDALDVNLTEVSGEWEPSELADKSDDWLRAYIKQLGSGKI